MSSEHRLESFQAGVYRSPAVPVRQRPQDDTTITGLEKSAALAKLYQVPDRPGLSRARSAEIHASSSDFGHQNKLPALTFSDLIDVINPLQHIPLISNVYRAITGDEISKPAQVAGDALYFGPIGAAVSVANLVIEETTGWNMGAEVASLFTGGAPNSEAPDSVESAEADLPDQSGASDAIMTAALSPATSASFVDNETLSPNQPFSFDITAPSIAQATPRAASFASSSGPIALESLPADILAALYSGQSARSANQDQIGAATAAPLAAENQTGPIDHTSSVEAAPRWSLWSSPDDALTTPAAAVRAYGGVMPDDAAIQGDIASQGGWFGANMAEVLARYQDGVNLQRQASKPFVDVSK